MRKNSRRGRPPHRFDDVDAACIRLREQGLSLASIAEKLRSELGRGFTKQAIHRRLRQCGITVPPSVLQRRSPHQQPRTLATQGFIWLPEARAALRLRRSRLERAIWAGELKARFVGTRRQVRVADLRRLWPARWLIARDRARRAVAAVPRVVSGPAQRL